MPSFLLTFLINDEYHILPNSVLSTPSLPFDPDVWANLTLVLGAGYYLQYNATVYLDPSQVSDELVVCLSVIVTTDDDGMLLPPLSHCNQPITSLPASLRPTESQYEDNYLYVVGDFWYLVNAVLYTVCSMRDAECFWFMPCNGRLQVNNDDDDDQPTTMCLPMCLSTNSFCEHTHHCFSVHID